MTEEEGRGGKMPRLTIMEEVLLLGLKDKQVRPIPFLPFPSLRGTERDIGWRRSGSAAVSMHCCFWPNCHPRLC